MTAMVQAAGLDVNEVPDGYVVYQTEKDRVHYLNATAAIIFDFCDGEQPAEEIIRSVGEAFGLAEARYGEVRACLDNLVREGLVTQA
jgi:hypothetical protein